MSTTLRQTLLDTIDCVAKGDLDLDKAVAIAELAKVHIESQRQAIEALRFAESVTNDSTIASAAKMIAAHGLVIDAGPAPLGIEADKPATLPTPKAGNTNKVPPRDKWKNLIIAELEQNQPLDLQEISRRTKISESNAYATLKAECFERDTDSMYWMA